MFISGPVSRLRVLLGAGLIAITSLSVCQVAAAQTSATNEWAWMGGSSMAGQSGVYGTLGTYAAGNIPGSRENAMSWSDSNGHLWLLGGLGYDANGNLGNLNDFWEFNPATNEWAWVGGSSTVGSGGGQPGVYGTLGTPSAGNIPGGRGSGASWTDSSGSFWLFGGAMSYAGGNESYLNDLWKFSPSTKEWAWMGGSSTVGSNCTQISGETVCGRPGVYGAQGAPSSGNIPGSRGTASSWIDGSGRFWLFGGYGYDANGTEGGLNDLWEFNPATNEWAWMGGSSTVDSSGGQPGAYGTLGTPSAGNVPGARGAASSWTDSSGHLWLFGGQGFDARDYWGDLNDLWEFNPSTQEWAWMGGSNSVYNSAAYGTLGTPAAGNVPGGRDTAAYWTDSGGNFWLFGGEGYDANGNEGLFNDLWEFNLSTNEWAWMGGSSTFGSISDPSSGMYGQDGVYGTLRTPAAGNIPGGRVTGAYWAGSSGHFWLFGGAGFSTGSSIGLLNDLWEFQPSAPAPSGKTTPTVTVTPGSLSITTAQALSVTVAVSGTPTPTGSVTLAGGGYTSTATTLTSGSASINIPAGSLATGSDTLTASYTPDANSSATYNSATGTSSAVEVTAAAPAINHAANAAATALWTPNLSAGGLAAVYGTFPNVPAGIVAFDTATGTFAFSCPDGTTVSVNGAAAPVSYCSPTQINYQVPYGVSGTAPTIVTTPNGGPSNAVGVPVVQTAPAVWPWYDTSGNPHGIVTDSNYLVITDPSKMVSGTPYILWHQGCSPTANDPPTGAEFGVNPLPKSVGAATLTIDGVAQNVLYEGGSPDLVSVCQMNFGYNPPANGVPSQGTLTVGTVSTTFSFSGPQAQSLTLTLSPDSVASGGTATGSVVLSTAAPSGGAVVALSSSSSAASLPAAVTVSAGTTSATFIVSAGSVSSSQTVTITASYAGSSAQASLTITPPAAGTGQLNVSGNPNGFSGGMYVGAAPTALTRYTVTNSGTGALSYTATADVNWLSFSPSSGTLAPGASADVTVSTNASTSSLAVGSYNANVTFSSGTTSIPEGITLVIVNPPPSGCSYASLGPYEFRVVNKLSTDAMVYFGNVVLPDGETGSVGLGLQMQPNECDIVGLPQIAVYDVDISRYPNGTVVSNSLTFTDTTSGFIFNGRSAYTVLVTSGTCSAAIDQGIEYLGQSVYSVCVP
jgi:uncharacterized protein (TIGR03437 family)